jgi:two-component system sensor histidine kinase UhpB
MARDDLDRDEILKKARADERHRLAAYLHDSIGQALCLTKLQLSRMRETLEGSIDPAKQTWLQGTIDSLLPELDTALEAIREEVFRLHTPDLTEVGLTPALELACVGFSRRTGIRCDRHIESLDLDADREAVILLIVREALSNIARHSRATTAEVSLQRGGERAVLSIRDDGVGIDPVHVTAADSFGIKGMKERAQTLGGELDFSSSPHEGSHLTVSFPLHPR